MSSDSGGSVGSHPVPPPGTALVVASASEEAPLLSLRSG